MADDIALVEHIEQLEWLRTMGEMLDGQADEALALERLLAAAVDRLRVSFGALTLPGDGENFTYASHVLVDAHCEYAYEKARPSLLTRIRQSGMSLVANRPPAGASSGRMTYRVLAVPVAGGEGEAKGAISFCRAGSQPAFDRLQLTVARHIARLIETILHRRYDPQTRLLTRAAFERAAARATDECGTAAPHALLYLDVDHLHVINETFGFDFGDQAIVRIARMLRPPLLPQDCVVGRLSGDRFLVLLPDCTHARAVRYAESLQHEISELRIGSHPQRVTLSASCGIANLPRSDEALPRAIAAAELACQVAKERGRDRAESYLDIDDGVLHHPNDILSVVRLRSALDENRLQIFAQKIVRLRNCVDTCGVDCQVRLLANDGEMVPSARFSATAGTYQLSRAIDEWTIKRTLRAAELHAIPLLHGEIDVSFRISEQSLHEDEFLDFVEKQVEQSQLSPGLITFEVDEGIVARDIARASFVFKRLRGLHCRVALDAFGKHPRSLVQLQRLRPDRVRIDGGLVRDVLASAECEATLRAILRIANMYDIDCVAACVESHAVAGKLLELGISHAQGNALHEAEPLSQLLESLNDEESRQLVLINQSY